MRFNNIIKHLGAAACCIASPFYMSPEPPLSQIIRGEYQDRIRRYSPPQKIFNVFASKNKEDKYTMDIEHILRAICFYNYSEYNEEALKDFDPAALKRFLGKQDNFQIYDYFNLIRFITYDRKNIKSFLKSKQITSLDKNSFTQLMLKHICSDYDSYICESIYIQSRQFKPSKEEYLKVVMRQADSLFKDKSSYTLQQLVKFRQQIIKELYTYEFKSYKTIQNQIDGVDFARSIVKYTQTIHKHNFRKRVTDIGQSIESIKISQDQYVNFHLNLQTNQKHIEQALSQKGALSRPQLQDLITNKVNTVSEGLLDILFRLLDADNSGFIEKKEMLGIISTLGYWKVKPNEKGPMELASIKWSILQRKMKLIWQIIISQ